MSTRAAIGYWRDNGQLMTIYSHYDGYPEYVGKILVEHWNSFEKCEELVAGPQIRNFDHDGTCVRFGDGSDEAGELYDSLADVLNSGYDYCYVYSNVFNSWKCFTKDSVTRAPVEKTIPSEEPAAEPFKSLNEVIGDFVKASDAKYNGYSHAAGYLSGMLLQAEARLPAEFVQLMIEHMSNATAECKLNA